MERGFPLVVDTATAEVRFPAFQVCVGAVLLVEIIPIVPTNNSLPSVGDTTPVEVVVVTVEPEQVTLLLKQLAVTSRGDDARRPVKRVTEMWRSDIEAVVETVTPTVAALA